MYYTDVFVGIVNNIDNLKNALVAELPDFNVNSDELTQLVHGLCLFMGYPSCLCKPKKSVEESLEKISKELRKEELKNYKCLNPNSDLNCSSCISSVVCKCCVLDCIREVQSSCECVKNSNNNDCTCSKDVDPKRCCKDLLEKLKASLSLLNLKADMESLCKCNDEKCCDKGECTKVDSSNCDHCKNLKTSKTPKDYTVTGLGLLRPSPKRLAERLEGFFGDSGTSKNGCNCQCGSGKSCCCLACPGGKCFDSCTAGCGSKCSSQPSPCPCKEFCSKINSIKVLEKSSDMRCCQEGAQCHCQVEGSNVCKSGSGCCVVPSGGNFQQGVKCMIRRLVRFFNGLPLDSSKSGCPKLCCEIFCVLKCCVFLRDFYNKGGKEKCGTCARKGKPCPGSKITPASNTCCNGTDGCKSPDCCQGCQECDAIKFRKALQTLKLSSPCGQDLYRVLDDFLHYCFNVFMPNHYFIRNTVLKAVKDCNNCTKSGTDSKSWKPCGCSSGPSSNCSACTSLLGDSKLMSVLLSQYSSSYDSSSAKWESLCPTTPKPPTCCCGRDSCSCQSSSSCCKSLSSSPCNPKNCCDACPQRKAAKIFLGMLPCLYYGLKILYDRSQDPVTWPDWQSIDFDRNGNPSSGLAKFLQALGYGLDPLKTKKGFDIFPILGILYGSSGNFKKLYNFVSLNYFVPSRSLSSGSSKSQPSPPSTVRQMLLWLYGLRFHKHFSDLVSHCKDLCLPFGNSFHPDAFCYYIHTCSFILPVAIISFIETSDSNATKFFSSAYSEFSKFFYPSDPSALADMFFDYIRKIYIALDFLKFQCERDKDSAGWKDCAFGQGCVKGLESSSTSVSSASSGCNPSSLPHGILCTSVPGHSNYHEHCINGKTCIGLKPCTDKQTAANTKTETDAHTQGKCKPSCPHPLLMFLIDGSDSQSKPQASSYSLFKLPKDSSVPPMGFSKDHLPTPGRNGHVLHDVLKPFCTNGFYPLTRLLKFLTRISFHPPETLGEFFLFFKKLAEALKSGPLSSKFVEWIDGEPGFYSGSDLKKAIQNLYGSSHSSSSHTPASLYSLYDCEGPRGSSPPHPTCGKYLHPLAQDASDNLAEDLVDTYLSWVCYLTPKFKTLFEKFKGKFSSCCSTGSCSSIVKCPCALATLYSQGFVYYSPSGLGCWNSWGEEHKKNNGSEKHSGGDGAPGCTRKTCKNFIEQLGKVLEENSPLDLLIKQIEKFLWHIRFPFFFGFLYVWFFALSYFCYVILIKLDTFHTGSHLHLPRSFKILPSTLFSDASSKLKDLSYFTL